MKWIVQELVVIAIMMYSVYGKEGYNLPNTTSLRADKRVCSDGSSCYGLDRCCGNGWCCPYPSVCVNYNDCY